MDETENLQTQTQTQNSQVEWTQNTPTFIPNIWGRLYSTKVTLSGKHCWNTSDYPEYLGKLLLTICHKKHNLQFLHNYEVNICLRFCISDLIQPEFRLGRDLTCTFPVRKNMVKENIIKNISKQHFIIKRDLL